MSLEATKDGDIITDEVLRYSTDELQSRSRLLDTEIKIMKSETMRISHELQAQKEKIKENTEKIKVGMLSNRECSASETLSCFDGLI